MVDNLVVKVLTMNRRRRGLDPPFQDPQHSTYGIGHKNKNATHKWRSFISVSSLAVTLVFFCVAVAFYTGMNRNNDHRFRSDVASRKTISSDIITPDDHIRESAINKKNDGRTIHSLKDLSPSEQHPEATATRHMVTPPKDVIPITLVTCETTKGFLHIAVHPSWAPLGASRFLRMVSTKYFSSKVAMMRCLKNFLCQFGIAGDPSLNKQFNGGGNNLKDDPNWLPEGPTHRTNELGVKRFSKGYLAYAGAGKNSRGNQLIVALANNEGLGGGSPWEVPWGEVVGEESFATLDKIYTGYDEKGPSQGRLMREGSSEAIAKDFPMLDYILSCEVVDSEKPH